MIVGVGKRGTGSGVARWREVHGSIHPRNRGARGALGRVRAFHSIQSTCSPALHVFFFTASLDGTLDRSSGSNADQKPELSSFCFSCWIDSVRVSAYSPSIHGMELHIMSQILPSCTAPPTSLMLQPVLARYPKKEIEINNKQCEFILAFGIDKRRPPNRLYLRTATKQEETERKRRGYHTTHLQ